MSTNIADWVEKFQELNPDLVEEIEKNKKKEHKLDLFKVILPALDRREKKFFEQCTEEEKKEIGKQIWLLTRWMSSSKSNAEHHLMMINDAVNMHSGSLKRHPQLQWQLLALSGIGKTQFHQWIAPPKGIKKNKLEEEILKIRPLLKDDDLELLLKTNSKEDLTSFFKDNGYSDKEIEELL